MFSDYFWEKTWYLQRFVAVHCDVHCSVHCACTVRALCKTQCLCPLIFSSAERCNSASGGVQAHSNLLRLCLVGSKFEAASVLGLRFWQMQKGIGSSLYLHIHKPKNLPRLSPGKIFWFTDVQTQA